MKKEDMKNLAKNAYEGYLERYDDENKIVIDLNGFDYCEECKDENGDLDLSLIEELNLMLFEEFEKNGYEVYKHGGVYAENGQLKNVEVDTAVAIK